MYAATLAAVNDEGIIVGGHVGGWVQTFPTSRFGKQPQEQMRRDFRMVTGRCLICGSADHKAKEHSKKPHLSQRAPTIPHASQSSARPISSVSTLARTAAQPSATPSSARPALARPAVALPTDDQLYDLWFTGSNPSKRDLSLDLVDDAWLPMVQVLKALGEKSSNNAKRYLSADSDCPKKLWRVGVRPTLGVENRDWKTMMRPRGGGGARGGGIVVRKTFLKKVVLAKYRHRLRPYP